MYKKHQIRIGLRLKAARERAGVTQQQLADGLGVKHRQIVARIEAGERSLHAQEFIRAMDLLGVDLDYFTDAFRLEGEGEFSFRTNPSVTSAVVDEFERRAGRWIAMYRELSAEQGWRPRWFGRRLELTSKSSFEDAAAAGEAVAAELGLGACPAETLRSAMEGRLGILVLDVDAPSGVSGAASRIPGLSCVLVNRRESEGRRNFDLAHELFHLLTWDAMPPQRTEAIEVARRGKGWRIERLAENFAAALLMPAAVVREHWDSRSTTDLYDLLNEGAVELRVSAIAYKWRAHTLGLLARRDLQALDDRRMVALGSPRSDAPTPPLFGRQFVERVAIALDAGRLSVKRAASLLDLSLPNLASLLESCGHEAYFEA